MAHGTVQGGISGEVTKSALVEEHERILGAERPCSGARTT